MENPHSTYQGSSVQTSQENVQKYIKKTTGYYVIQKIFVSNNVKYLWSFLLIFSGLGQLFFFQILFERLLIKRTMGINIQDYYTPHYDLANALDPVVGAILLVGGLILWYLPDGSSME